MFCLPMLARIRIISSGELLKPAIRLTSVRQRYSRSSRASTMRFVGEWRLIRLASFSAHLVIESRLSRALTSVCLVWAFFILHRQSLSPEVLPHAKLSYLRRVLQGMGFDQFSPSARWWASIRPGAPLRPEVERERNSEGNRNWIVQSDSAGKLCSS